MADKEYEDKLESLQKYIPFLVNMMAELKVKGNREAQLNKIQSLHEMITDNRKKLKLETLNRCEEVLTNIYFKVNPQLKIKGSPPLNNLPGIENPIRANNLPGVESPRSTPASPSPPRDVIHTKPVTIPTEKIDASSASSSSSSTKKSHLPKVDVYSNAVLNDPAKVTKSVIAAKIPDMSKPPISLDDLKTLEDDVQQKISDVTFANASVDTLQEYRKQLELQLRIDSVTSAMSPKKSTKDTINTTVRNNPSLSKKLSFTESRSTVQESPKASGIISSAVNESKTLTCDKKPLQEDTRSTKVSKDSSSKSPQKVVKESSSVFGSLLSSIDDKLLEEKKKYKKNERRSSLNLSKEDSGSVTSLSSDKSDIKETEVKTSKGDRKSSETKDKKSSDTHTHRRSSLDKHKHKHKEKSRDKSKDKTYDEKESSVKGDKKRNKEDKHKSKEHKEKSSKSSSHNADLTLKSDRDIEEQKTDKIVLLSDILLSRSKANSNKNTNLSENSSGQEVSSISNLDQNTGFAETTSKSQKDLKSDNTDNTDRISSAILGKTQPQNLPKTSPIYKRLADKYNPKPKPKIIETEAPDVDKCVSDSIENLMKVSPAKPLLSPLSEPKPSQSTTPDFLTGQTKPVQLPDIIQKIFSKPLLGDIIPKRLNENTFPLTNAIQNKAPNLGHPMTKPCAIQPPEPPILSPPHRPLHFQPPEGLRNFKNFIPPSHRQEVIPIHDMNARPNAILPTPGSQHGLLPTPPIPPSLPRAFSDHNPIMDMGYGTPRMDFDTPSTPMPDFDSPRVDFEPPVHVRNEQFNVNPLFISPMHQDPQIHNFDPRNQTFLAQPHFQHQPEPNVFNNQLVPGMGYYAANNQMPLLSPEVPLYMPEQNFYQERAWPEKPRWNRDRRPGDPRNYREYKKMRERQEREAKAAQEKQIEIKDPRLAPRDSRDVVGEKDVVVRDPRLVRDSVDRNVGDKLEMNIRDPRLSRGREKSVDRERYSDTGEEREKSQDLRDQADRDCKDLRGQDFRAKNRDMEPRERARSRERAMSRLRDASLVDSVSRPRERESRFDKMYSRTNRARSRSRSRPGDDKNDEDESFVSPLDSLYNAGEQGKTGRGYGVQNFKIPRKSRIDDVRRTDEKRNETRSKSGVIRKKHCIESSDSSDESDKNDVDNNSVPESISDVESIEENNSKDGKKCGIQTKENIKDKVNEEKVSDFENSRIKVVIKTSETRKNENKFCVWDSESVEAEAEDTDLSNFVSEYDREFHSQNKDQLLVETIDENSSTSVKSLNKDPNTSVNKSKIKAVSDVQVEEPSSSQDTRELIKTVSSKVAATKRISNEFMEADSSKQYDNASTSQESQNNLENEFKKPIESIETDGFKNSEGSLTSQEGATKSDEPSEQKILAHFFENLLKSNNKKDKKSALFSLIETFSDSFDVREIEKIRKIIKVNEDDEESDDEGSESKRTTEKRDDIKESTQEVTTTYAIPVQEEQPVVGSTTEEVSAVNDNKLKKADANSTEEIINTTETQVNEVSKSSEELEHSSIEESKSEELLSQTNVSETTESLEPVMVSVGERIKNRKRNSTLSKPRKKGKTELDLLHEDIQDMFIRDGVLTATGKRMCRILKDDPTALSVNKPETPPEQPKKLRKKPGPKPKPKINKEEVQNSMRDMRIVIKKMPDNVIATNTSATRQLRKRNRLSSYAESDDDSQKINNEQETPHQRRSRSQQGNNNAESDDDSQKGNQDNDTTVPEDNDSLRSEIEGELSSESEDEDNKSHTSDGASKPRIRRRRIPKWASGIIPKIKKKKTLSKSEENSPSPSRAPSPDLNITNEAESDFDRLVEPDKHYYYDYTNKSKMRCKLCKYSGHLLTGHYLKEHPHSEILCSRLAPDVASEAIRDFSVNGKKYEGITNMKMSTKCNYSCRVCGFSSTTSPIFFYEHVTTHTGEYRHQCGICEYYAVTGKTMAGHFLSAHPDQEKKAIRRTYTLAVVFGYICGECNFLQLKEKSVEDHVNIFHLGEKPTIYKINMSTILDPIFDTLNSSQEVINSSEPISNISAVSTENEVSNENIAANENKELTPLPVPKTRKKPGAKPKSPIKESGVEDDNEKKKKSTALIKKKPGPKSKTMQLVREEQDKTIEEVEETPHAVPVVKKPGPKSKTQKAKSPVTEEPSTDNEPIKQSQKKKKLVAKEVSLTPTHLGDVEDSIKETPIRKRRRSLDKLISEDSGDDLDTIITLSSRSSRAAKEKATAKLKSLMESNEGLSIRKKLDSDSTRKEKEKENDEEQPHTSKAVSEKDDNHPDKTGEESGNEISEKNVSQEPSADNNGERGLLPALKVKKSDKKDLNVFTCKTDILEEDAKKIEEERLRKMEELNKSIGSRTSKLAFVDKLSSRLNSEQMDNRLNEQFSENSEVNIKQEPKDDFLGSSADSARAQTPTMPVLEKQLPSPISLTRTPPSTSISRSASVSKKPTLEEDTPLPQSNINFRQNKTNSLFSNMIEKLQGKVNEAAVQQQQRPNTSSQSTNEELSSSNAQRLGTSEVLISIGDLITATKKDNEIIYSCHANNCYVATKDKMVFQLHCKFGHKDLSVTSSLCEKCGVVIEVTPDTSLLENLYDHLVFAHFECIVKSTNLRMRRLSGDKLSVKQEVFEKSLAKSSSKEKEETSAQIPQATGSSPAEALPDSVPESAETEPTTEVSAATEKPVQDEPLNDEPAATEATLELAEDNPFSFKIANVMSLAKTSGLEEQCIQSPPSQNKPKTQELILKPVPPLTFLSIAKQQSTVQQKNLIVQEAKLTSAEAIRTKKAPKALQKFVDTPGDLYKCPHFYCMFSTNVRTFLERHLKTHKSDSESMVPCVYCDMKTPWEHVPMHIDIRHANCRFACSYCLYRACLKEYVCLHQEQTHSDKEFMVLALPPHKAKKFSVADAKIDCRMLCEPFRCVCLSSEGGKQKEYLFENEFALHLNTTHENKYVSCGYAGCKHRVNASLMLNHWAMFHGVCTYQCGYCKTSTKELTRMYIHFAQVHPSTHADILARVNDHLPKDRELGYSKEAFEKLGHIKKIPQNLLATIGKRSQRSIKLIHFNSSTSSEDPAVSFASETPSTGTSSVRPLLPMPTLQPVSALPATQTQQPKIIISNPNVPIFVASTSGKSEKLYLIPASMMSPNKGKSVTSMAPISKVVAQTSPAMKTILGKAGESVVTASPLPETTITAITSSNLPFVPVKIGDTAIHSLGKVTESRTITSSHATIAALSRSLPTTVASGSSLITQKLPLKLKTNKVEKDLSTTSLVMASENSKRTESPASKMFQTKAAAAVKPVELTAQASASESNKLTKGVSDFVESISEETNSQHSSTGLSEDDILQSAIQSILDADDLSEHSTAPKILTTGSVKDTLLDSSTISENTTKSNKENVLIVEEEASQSVLRSSTPGTRSVSTTVPPPLVLISNGSKSDKVTVEAKMTKSSSQSSDYSSTSPTSKVAQDQHENTPQQVAPVEHIELSGDVPDSSILSEDIDPLNIDTLETNNSNLEPPLFDDINVGIDSPPEDPLTITPTFNSNLPSSDPLSIDESETTTVSLKGSEEQASTRESIQDPLNITSLQRSVSLVSNSDDESDSSGTEKGKKRGLMGYQLYRCASCNLSFSNIQTFKSHMGNSLRCKKSGNRQYQCVHCEKTLKTPQRLVDHVQIHGVPRFACSLCNEKFPTVGIVKLHMKNRHNIHQTNLVPLQSDRSNMYLDDFMVKPCQANQPTIKDKDLLSESPKQASDEFTFNPDQIDSIPIRQIFSNNVKCGKCNYQTKVRVNIVRHLQMHLEEKTVPDMAPVNPVPCLEKNEKMFDKMINLAASSITTGRMGGTNPANPEKEDILTEFIPSHRRFVCAAQGCSYLCPEEANLKHHLMALHSDEVQFVCRHCKKNIEPTDPDSVIKHLKLHGLHLYKCHYCDFVHHLKHKVEKHITDGHLDAVVKVITVRSMETEPVEFGNVEEVATPPTTTTSTKFKPWRCGMCKVKCHTKEDIQSHVLHRHDIDSQYKCTLCAFKSDKEDSVKGHFQEKHPSHEIDIIFVYQKVEEEAPKDDVNVTPFDTTPLWQRDKPRIRHIRGILFDESSSPPPPPPPATKSPKKPLKTYAGPSTKATSSSNASSSSSKNLFDCIDAVARGTADTLQDKITVNASTAKSNTVTGSSEKKNTVSKERVTYGGKKDNKKNISNEKIASIRKEDGLKDNSKETVVSSRGIDVKQDSSEEIVAPIEKKANKQSANVTSSDNDDVIEIKQPPSIIVIDSDSDESSTDQKNSTDTKPAPEIDDTPKSKDKDNKSKPVSKNRGLKRQGTTDVLQEAVKMAKIENPEDDDSNLVTNFNKDHLISLYGSFGTPHNKQWLCPKCRHFKSKRPSDLMFHIYKDFNVYRYKCKACSDLSITYKYMVDHISLHPGFTEDIIEALPANAKLETWVHMVIREQSLMILKNSPLMKKRPITGPTDISCYFCNEKFMSMPDCYEHMLYHWAMMPYQCQYCPNEFYTVYDLKHHHKIEHPDLKQYLEPKGPTLQKAIQCIENVKKRPIPRSTPDSPSRKKTKVETAKDTKEAKIETEVITGGIVINPPKSKTGQKTDSISASASTADIIKIDDDDDDLVIVLKTDDKVPDDDEVYACDACAYMADTEALTAKHLLDSHGVKTNRFHTLSKKKAEIPSAQDMACNKCDSVFSELKLRRHFLDTHLESHTFCPYRFKCDICFKKYLTLPKVKVHFTRCHPGMPIKYVCVIQNAGKTLSSSSKNKLYSCTMCSYTNISHNTAAVRAHLRGHLKPVVCNYCNARFKYHSEIQSHHNKEHPGLEINAVILEEVQKVFTETVKEICSKATPVTHTGAIEQPPMNPVKNVARKSTSAPFMSPKTGPLEEEEGEYSYYGVPLEKYDLSNISTTFELEGLEYTTTAEQMMKMFNLEPFVDVSDSAVNIMPLDKS